MVEGFSRVPKPSRPLGLGERAASRRPAGTDTIKTSLSRSAILKGALFARERSQPPASSAVAAGPFKLSHDSKLLSLRYERQQSSREQLTVQDARYLTYVLP